MLPVKFSTVFLPLVLFKRRKNYFGNQTSIISLSCTLKKMQDFYVNDLDAGFHLSLKWFCSVKRCGLNKKEPFY